MTPTVMTLIEKERQRDRFIKRLCIAAWAISLALVLVVAGLVALGARQFIEGALRGEMPWAVAVGSTMPLFDALWKLSLLLTAVSTVAVFMRQRTSSLAEIQLRLAALEEMVASGSGRTEKEGR
jgi:hypothetical protein